MSIYSYKMATLMIEMFLVGFKWPSLWINCMRLHSTERSELGVILAHSQKKTLPRNYGNLSKQDL